MGKLKERYSNWVRNWDGIQGFDFDYSISARIGKHCCPYCNELLHIKRIVQVVNSESEEAKRFNFYGMGGNMKGNVKFSWDVFYCANCDKELPTGEMIQYERELKKAGGYVDFEAFRKSNNNSSTRVNWSFLKSCLIIAVFMLIHYIIVHFTK